MATARVWRLVEPRAGFPRVRASVCRQDVWPATVGLSECVAVGSNAHAVRAASEHTQMQDFMASELNARTCS